MKHTPGPWYANGIVVRPANVDRNPCIAVADDQDRLRDEQEANARLIAAAPEMLNALRELVAEWDENHAHESYRTGLTPETVGIAMARRAIAKVEA